MRKDGKKGNRNAVGADLQEHESIGGEQVENPPHIDEAALFGYFAKPKDVTGVRAVRGRTRSREGFCTEFTDEKRFPRHCHELQETAVLLLLITREPFSFRRDVLRPSQ